MLDPGRAVTNGVLSKQRAMAVFAVGMATACGGRARRGNAGNGRGPARSSSKRYARMQGRASTAKATATAPSGLSCATTGRTFLPPRSVSRSTAFVVIPIRCAARRASPSARLARPARPARTACAIRPARAPPFCRKALNAAVAPTCVGPRPCARMDASTAPWASRSEGHAVARRGSPSTGRAPATATAARSCASMAGAGRGAGSATRK